MNNENEWEKVEKRLREFIHNKLSDEYGQTDDVNDDTELVDNKILSSLLLIDLLAGIEALLDTEVVNDEVGIEDFSTINKIILSVKKSYKNA